MSRRTNPDTWIDLLIDDLISESCRGLGRVVGRGALRLCRARHKLQRERRRSDHATNKATLDARCEGRRLRP